MRTTALRTALSAVLLALAAGCGGTDTPPAATPTTPTVQATSSPMPTPAASLARSVFAIKAPDSLGGRKKLTDATHTQLVSQTEATIKSSSTGLATAVVGYYGTADPAKNKMYMFGATMTFTVDSFSFARSLADITNTAGKLTNIQKPAQGDLGGTAECGQVTIEKMPTAVCGWYVDKHMVFVMYYNHQVGDLVAELPKLRAEIEVAA
ncbi:hypothetical protein [Catelliglobosispora koreensis]|uniref:hypothetical protein n=1 Tax=Catelliglobosispora koreensis TaxID=129052 RepID=UPI00039B7225|nr:hypothetical protein [Catelliglobosispora koreensis]